MTTNKYGPKLSVLQKGQIVNRIFIIALVLMIGIAVAGNYFLKKQPDQDSPPVFSLIPTGADGETPDDIVSDGNYINHKYGFRFSYPESTFVTFQNKSGNLEAVFSDNIGAMPKKYKLYLFVNDADFNVVDPEGNLTTFNRYYGIEPGDSYFPPGEESIHSRNSIKIKNIKENDFIGYILYEYDSLLAQDSEPAVSHNADVLHTDLLISFVLTSPGLKDDDQLAGERLKMLEGIINTLEFSNN